MQDRSIEQIFGWPDVLKLRLSMTLFSCATETNEDFHTSLARYYGGGKQDPVTLALLSS
ncbi:hypothetical protein MB901379_02548 [Mycobacterium basiliense]|uniref:Uncharacterized protein n=1 Tax=Mycobacterium basiliense TaxID=2094119 RepID=A0A3S4BWB5_9MYCO|nr:hypothetical protein MB901379_02548 [Mycobacterium basiliense]